MILDNIKNCSLYFNVNEYFSKGFTFIEKYMKESLPLGRYEIEGDMVYALVMNCDLKENGRLETHNKYIDIQFVVLGEEIIGIAPKTILTVEEDLSEEKDVIFYLHSEEKSNIKLRNGDFAIFFPGEAHEPCLELNDYKKVVKIVVKIAI